MRNVEKVCEMINRLYEKDPSSIRAILTLNSVPVKDCLEHDKDLPVSTLESGKFINCLDIINAVLSSIGEPDIEAIFDLTSSPTKLIGFKPSDE